jgi:3-deoxy-7-phosphoheptulonate synthase
MTHGGTELAYSAASPEALRIFNELPTPDYSRNYQPTYKDQNALLGAIHELCETRAVTAPRQVDSLRDTLAAIALNELDSPIAITERCAEPVSLELPLETLAEQAYNSRQQVLSIIPNALVIQRNRGQVTKPRSAFMQSLPGGLSVVSYMGDAVNGEAIDKREPEPSRMVGAAIQARHLEARLTELAGEHVPAAHEALLLPYEKSFIRKEGNKSFLLSADLPWIGKRTNAVDGDHVAMLSEVENPIGIKIGPNSTAEHIKQLQERLNPYGEPGKLVFMLRMGRSDSAVADEVLDGIKEYALNSLIMYDIHGVTETAPTGEKIRLVGNIISQIKDLSIACGRAGLKLHGVHLETIADETRLECVDEPGQLPTHPGGVDPQLNPRQLQRVLSETAEYLL